jgi:hypothetical protein
MTEKEFHDRLKLGVFNLFVSQYLGSIKINLN